MEGGVISMSLAMQYAQKNDVVQKIKSEVETATVVIFADFRGLTAKQMSELRQKLSSEGGSIAVYKNTLMRRALGELSIGYPDEFLVGPSVIVSTSGDAVRVAKALVAYAKDVERLNIKGGLLVREVLYRDTIKVLSELPGREELLSKIASVLQSPLRRLVGSLSSPARGLVCVLHAIKEKKSEV